MTMAGRRLQKTRQRVDCNYCNSLRGSDGDWKLFSNLVRLRHHLTGDAAHCKGNGGVGACPDAPEEVQTEFCQIIRWDYLLRALQMSGPHSPSTAASPLSAPAPSSPATPWSPARGH